MGIYSAYALRRSTFICVVGLRIGTPRFLSANDDQRTITLIKRYMLYSSVQRIFSGSAVSMFVGRLHKTNDYTFIESKTQDPGVERLKNRWNAFLGRKPDVQCDMELLSWWSIRFPATPLEWSPFFALCITTKYTYIYIHGRAHGWGFRRFNPLPPLAVII